MSSRPPDQLLGGLTLQHDNSQTNCGTFDSLSDQSDFRYSMSCLRSSGLRLVPYCSPSWPALELPAIGLPLESIDVELREAGDIGKIADANGVESTDADTGVRKRCREPKNDFLASI